MIHIFSPFKIYLFPFFTARVSMPLGLEPNCGSVRPKQPMALPCWKERQPFIFLRVAAVSVDGIHDQSALHGYEAAQTGIAAFELLGYQAVGDIGHSSAP